MEGADKTSKNMALEESKSLEIKPSSVIDEKETSSPERNGFLEKSKKVLSYLKEGWRDSNLAMRIGISFIASGVAFFALVPVIEQYKRLSAEDDYEKAKDLLKEYVIDYSPETYQYQYLEAVDLFGENNLTWFNAQGKFDKFHHDTSLINQQLRLDHDNRRNVILDAYSPHTPKFFNQNEYSEKFRKVQQKIETLSGKNYEGVDSTKISYGDAAIGFRDENKPEIFDTLKQESLKKIIYETYPKNWFFGEVSSLKLSNNPDTDSSTNMYGSNLEAVAHMTRAGQEMEFFKYNENFENNPRLTISVLGHEAGHANDWESNKVLTPKERLNLLINVANRLDDENRFISNYVENKIVTKDPKSRLYVKATEYWAEICGEYFTNGNANLAPEDVALIEGIIKKKDADFDTYKSINKRALILHKDVYKEDPRTLDIFDQENLLNVKKLWVQKVKESDNFYRDSVCNDSVVRGKLKSWGNMGGEFSTYETRDGNRYETLDRFMKFCDRENLAFDNLRKAIIKYNEENKKNISITNVYGTVYQKYKRYDDQE